MKSFLLVSLLLASSLAFSKGGAQVEKGRVVSCEEFKKRDTCHVVNFSSKDGMYRALASGAYLSGDPTKDFTEHFLNIKKIVNEAYKNKPAQLDEQHAKELGASWVATHMSAQALVKKLSTQFGDCKINGMLQDRYRLLVRDTGLVEWMGNLDSEGRFALSFNNFCNFRQARGIHCAEASLRMTGKKGFKEAQVVSQQESIKMASEKFKIRGKGFKRMEDFEELEGKSFGELLMSGVCNKTYPDVPLKVTESMMAHYNLKNAVAETKSPKFDSSDRQVVDKSKTEIKIDKKQQSRQH